jgi:hypothetical protein
MTLAGGAVFGLLVGALIISFASSIGATLAFLIVALPAARLGEARFGQRWRRSTRASGADGAFYLFTLRLVPVFPFFMINLLMGLTAMKARTFYWVSQLGMLAGTVVYVNAGTQLAKIDSLCRHPLAGPARLVRPARRLPADRAQRSSMRSQNQVYSRWTKPAASTATWSSSAPAAPGWSRPTSRRR